MKRLVLAGLIAGASVQAHAVGDLADVMVIDRETGQTLPVYSDRGDYWVAGRPGGRYSIRIRNNLGERLLAVTSVDGVNIVTGATASWNQSGYVYSPWQSYELTGWRKSDTEVAAFEFTAEPNSYASRTGRPAHVGVIGVALFRESLPVPVLREREVASAESASAADESRASGAPASPASSPNKSSVAQAANGRMAAAPQPKLGTGHGAREQSVVEQTSFDRMQESPNEVIRIRYDSRPNLVAMGVIRERPRHEYPTPQPFPDSPVMGYVPDPPGGG